VCVVPSTTGMYVYFCCFITFTNTNSDVNIARWSVSAVLTDHYFKNVFVDELNVIIYTPAMEYNRKQFVDIADVYVSVSIGVKRADHHLW